MAEETEEIDLNELMMRDPLDLTDDNIDSIIGAMRDRRTRFNLGDTKAGSAKPKAPPKALKGLDSDVLDLEVKL